MQPSSQSPPFAHLTALDSFKTAHNLFANGKFYEARKEISEYKKYIDYTKFPRTDTRINKKSIHSSVVIVSHGGGKNLLSCLDSLALQIDQNFEIILVDQGENNEVHSELKKRCLLWIKPPINLLPSEGRNLGASFALGELLIFLDDDAFAKEDFVSQAFWGMRTTSALAIRGRILPSEIIPSKTNGPNHYDLGTKACLALADLEGNLVIRRSAFELVKGFDPLMFGHEGRELGFRLHEARNNGLLNSTAGRGIYYWPYLLIIHDYAVGNALEKKQKRQLRGREYLKEFSSSALGTPEQMDPDLALLNKATNVSFEPTLGITLLLRPPQDQRAAAAFLRQLANYNSFRPLEILIATHDTAVQVAMIKPFLGNLKIIVLNAQRLMRSSSISEVVTLGRYSLFGFVTLNTNWTSDPLPVMASVLESNGSLSCGVPAVIGAGPNRNQLLLCQRWALGCLIDKSPDSAIQSLAKSFNINSF